MKELWTGDLIGRMHNAGIKRRELADELGVSCAYVTMILNGTRTADKWEEKFEQAFQAVHSKKYGTNK